MTTETVFAEQALQASKYALKRGERLSARRWAERALFLAPEMELPWLILAAISKPEASVGYLEHVLELYPDSKKVKAGMSWAIGRVEKERRRIELEEQMFASTRPMPAGMVQCTLQLGRSTEA